MTRFKRRSRFSRELHLESLETRRLLAGDPILDGQSLMISEFVANNNQSLLTRTRPSAGVPFEGELESPDWIELLNVSRQAIDLGGMHLTDDAADPTQWEFPAGTTIEAGSFLVVFASGSDIRDASLDEQNMIHTNFRLDAEGEYLALIDRDGDVVHEFLPSYPAQRTDVSYSVPMQQRMLVGDGNPLQFLVPGDQSLEPAWRQPGFEHPQLVTPTDTPASPIGFDRGGAAPIEQAESLGAELIDRDRIDFARGSLVVLESMPFTVAGAVSDWSIYSETTRSITPLVLRAVVAEFEIVGIGRTRTSDGSGVQTFAFDLQSGSDTVESEGYFFGFKDGDNQTEASGVVPYNNSDVDSARRYNGPLAGSLVAGNTLSDGRSWGRTYSAQVTTRARLAGPIHTDVAAEMADATSLYVRYPFQVEQTDTLQSMRLNIRYDDGFVAYLNGVEVARRNVPDAVQVDSTADSNRLLKDANRFEEINVSEHIGLLQQGANVLAVHGINDSADGSEFLIDAKLIGIDVPSVADIGYASSPTPGAVSRTVFEGFLETTSLSHSRGFYDAPISLRLTTPETPDAAIYFTTDGTDPSADNPNATRYVQPLPISATTNLRVASFLGGWLPSVPTTHTFVFTDDVLQQDTLQTAITEDPVWGPQMEQSLLALPTISLVTTEPIQVEGEFFTSAELIHPDGSEGFQVNAGIEVFGGTAVSFPKRSLRISFKNVYGPSIFNYDLFDDPDGVQEFDQLILRPGSHDTPFWTGAEGAGVYIRNRWANDRQLDQGQPAPRGRFVHLYLNGVYWGQYQLMERPNAAFMASNFGGSKEDYDVLNAGSPIDGDEIAWNELLNALDDGYDAVKQYLDVVNYADYILLQWFGGNTVDWRSESNWIAARRREPGAGFQFFAWDSDIILRTGADSDIVHFGGPGFLWTRNGGVQQYPEFRKLLAERAQMYFFDEGIFTDASLRRQIDELIEQLQVSIVAETARWGSGRYTPQTWLEGMQWIKDTYAPLDGTSRAATVIEQMRHAGVFPLSDQPQFEIDGQILRDDNLMAGDLLSMSAPAGDIYYTIDGGDPWQNLPTLDYEELVAADSAARLLVPSDGTLRRDWTAPDFDDSNWMAGSNGIGFDTSQTQELATAINLDIQQQMKDVNSSVYLRVPFQVTDPSQFDSLEFAIQYDDAFVAYLNGVEVARRNVPGAATWSSSARTAHANIEAVTFEGFNLSRELNLLQPGENVLAIHGLNVEPSNIDFLLTPSLRAGVVTDAGIAPTAIRYTDDITVSPETSVKARTLWGDQWSTLREASTETAPFPLRVSEVMFHPPDPNEVERAAGFDDADDFEFIELVNISNRTIDLSQVELTQTVVGGQSVGISFDFNGNAVRQLAPDQRVLIVENTAAFALRYGNQLPVAGQWSGGLNNDSEQITILANGRLLQQFTYDDAWYPATDGNGSSLEIVDALNTNLDQWNQRSSWQPSRDIGGTPGVVDVGPILGDANGDGVFDRDDLLVVFQSAEYEDDTANNSTFAEGDWNGDGDFTSADLVAAFKTGRYMPAVPTNASEIAAAVDIYFSDEQDNPKQ